MQESAGVDKRQARVMSVFRGGFLRHGLSVAQQTASCSGWLCDYIRMWGGRVTGSFEHLHKHVGGADYLFRQHGPEAKFIPLPVQQRFASGGHVERQHHNAVIAANQIIPGQIITIHSPPPFAPQTTLHSYFSWR
ncbi:hypothetical protein [Phytobacter sp. V91]|uniref:hypothetical protein n=1 Tax=Phytobacter sp. V91 TaxID=3369425 RepID=UPI003F637D23